MRIPWKVLGLAGLGGVAATGVVLVRNRRAQADVEPDELRARLHRRLDEATAERPASDPPGPAGAG
jgi:hypothetical protein